MCSESEFFVTYFFFQRYLMFPRSQPTSESEDPHDNMSTEPGREDSEPEILVDQSQSEEGELPTDMTMGLQLLRQKLQQQQNTQSQSMCNCLCVKLSVVLV